MPLSRAELLMGDSAQGPLLPGQVQGVKESLGIAINANGEISVNYLTAVGVMKMSPNPVLAAGAYNGYTWPLTDGAAGSQLTTDGAGILTWKDPDGIPWTNLGQLVVGTGIGTQTILNAGADGEILVADGTSPSGLAYTSKYVAKTSSTGSAAMPAGTTLQRDASPLPGYLRYNSVISTFEFYDGGSWQGIVSTPGPIPSPLGSVTSVNVSGGTTGMSFSGGPVTTTGTMTMSGTLAVANGGTGATSGAAALSNLGLSINASGGSTGLNFTGGPITGVGILTLGGTLSIAHGGTGSTSAAAALANMGMSVNANGGTTGMTFAGGPITSAGTLLMSGTLNIANGGTGATTGSAALTNLGMSVDVSGGTTGMSFTGGPVTNAGTVTMGGILGIANGGTGVTTGLGALQNLGMSVNASGGTTGLSFTGGPIFSAGTLTLGGTLGIANGGTGGTTQQTAINNLLPAQGGNPGEVLTTDGTNVSWSVPAGLAAWVACNGATNSVYGSSNVSSVTMVAGANYWVNFATPLVDANYAVAGMYTDVVSGYQILKIATTGFAAVPPTTYTNTTFYAQLGGTGGPLTSGSSVVSFLVAR